MISLLFENFVCVYSVFWSYSWGQWPCHAQKMLCSFSAPQYQLIYLPASSSSVDPVLGEGYDTRVSFVAGQSLSLCTQSSCEFLLIVCPPPPELSGLSRYQSGHITFCQFICMFFFLTNLRSDQINYLILKSQFNSWPNEGVAPHGQHQIYLGHFFKTFSLSSVYA